LPLRCPACGAPNRTDAKFCHACGAALDQHTQIKVAPSNETEGPQPSDFAFALGTAVETEAVPEGERKMVTALFVDIMGSTELGQDLDPEEARSIIDPALALMIDAVRRYDGYVPLCARSRRSGFGTLVGVEEMTTGFQRLARWNKRAALASCAAAAVQAAALFLPLLSGPLLVSTCPAARQPSA
jgi:class 3 adenylate cyclase